MIAVAIQEKQMIKITAIIIFDLICFFNKPLHSDITDFILPPSFSQEVIHGLFPLF